MSKRTRDQVDVANVDADGRGRDTPNASEQAAARMDIDTVSKGVQEVQLEERDAKRHKPSGDVDLPVEGGAEALVQLDSASNATTNSTNAGSNARASTDTEPKVQPCNEPSTAVANDDVDKAQDLEALLDFSDPSLSNLDDIFKRFDRIAELIMREYVLTVEVYAGDGTEEDAPQRSATPAGAASPTKPKSNSKSAPPASPTKGKAKAKSSNGSSLHNGSITIKNAADGRTSRITEFQIMEMEYYLLKGECHEDPFTHGSEEQKFSARWYFHRAPKFSADSHRSLTSTTMYRTGSRKGLDLTIGRPILVNKAPSTSTDPENAPSESSAQSATSASASGANASTDPNLLKGGILLRAIRNIRTNKTVLGPSLLVDEILGLAGVTEVHELVDDQWKGDISAFLPATDGSSAETGNVTTTSPSRLTRMYFKRTSGIPSVASVATATSSVKSMFFMPTKERQKALEAAQAAAPSSSSPTPPAKTKDQPVIHRSPRIGLELSHPGTKPSPTHPRVVYVQRPYRYFIHPDLLTANGRAHTFLGVLDWCVRDMFKEEIKGMEATTTTTPDGSKTKTVSLYTILSTALSGKSASSSKIHKLKKEVSRLTGIKEPTADKYYSSFISGLNDPKVGLVGFVGAHGKGVSSSPGNYLKMMGVVERVLSG
ncbi:hypothetical protein AX16_010081 [Volvariella volvacea WC 439]|nr:hypothetical protein AX16_010081 [Volvariella volvacea WC 439]